MHRSILDSASGGSTRGTHASSTRIGSAPLPPNASQRADASGERVVRNTATLATGEIIGKLATLAVFVVLARKSGHAVGVWVFAQALVQITTMPMDLGVDRWLMRRIAADPAEYRAQYPGALAVKVVLLVPCALLTAAVVVIGGSDAQTQATVALTFVGFTLDAAARTNTYVFNAFEHGRPAATATVTQRFVAAALGIAAIAAGWSAVGVAGAYAIGSAASVVLSLFLLRAYVSAPPRSIHLRRWREVATVSLPFAVQDVLTVLLFKLDVVILSFMAGVAAVARYGSAYRLLESTFFLTYSISAAFAAMFTYLDREGELDVQTALVRALKLIFVLLTPIAMAFGLLAEPIATLFFGHGLAGADRPLRILAPVTVLLGTITVLTTMATARAHPRRIARVTGAMVVLNVVLNVALIPRFDDVGAATAMLITELVFLVAALRIVEDLVGRVRWRGIVAGPFCGAVAMALVILPLRGIWPVGVVVGLAAYVACFYAVDSRVAPGEFAFVTGLMQRRLARR